MIQPTYLEVTATDISRQKRIRAKKVRWESTMADLVQDLLPRLHLPAQDADGRPLNYHARLDREGRHVHSSEVVGQALRQADEITIQPDVVAGGTGCSAVTSSRTR